LDIESVNISATHRFRTTLRLVLTLVFSAGLAACGANQVIVSPILDFPTPLVEPIPVHIGVYYSQSFSNFVYDESKDSQGVDDTSIHLGQAQVSMFDRVLTAYFSKVQVLERGEPASKRAGLDAVLVPQVVDVEYSVPRTSKAKIYEVWIKYQFDLLTPDGTTIAKWTMPVYGKTPTAFLKSNDEAINLASMMALRDSGAAFITGFSRVPEVAQWLDSSIGGSDQGSQVNQGGISNE
jgi:hypothetical protein